MSVKWFLSGTGFALSCFVASAAYCADVPVAGVDTSVGAISDQTIASVKPGATTKAQVEALLGTPWRTMQFDDCGMPMPDQANEMWDYRGKDAKSTFHVHIEFDDKGIVRIVGKVPDKVPGGKGTVVKAVPNAGDMSM